MLKFENNNFFKEYLNLKRDLNNSNKKDLNDFEQKKKGLVLSIIDKEINQEDKKNKVKLFLDNGYSKENDYYGEWSLYFESNNNLYSKYKLLFNELIEEKTKLLKNSINREIEILNFKLNNLNDYFSLWNEERKIKDEMILKYSYSINKNKKTIDIKEFKDKLLFLLEILENYSLDFNKIQSFKSFILNNKHNFDLDFVYFSKDHAVYLNNLSIYNFIFNNNEYIKDIFIDISNGFNMFRDSNGNKNKNNVLFLGRYFFETIENSLFMNKYIKRIQKVDGEENTFIKDTLENISKILNLKNKYKNDKKGFFFINQSICLKKSNNINLKEGIFYYLKKDFYLDNNINLFEKIKTINLEINLKFLYSNNK